MIVTSHLLFHTLNVYCLQSHELPKKWVTPCLTQCTFQAILKAIHEFGMIAISHLSIDTLFVV
jgi:hypothetical protein